jgi:hypothetical protein
MGVGLGLGLFTTSFTVRFALYPDTQADSQSSSAGSSVHEIISVLLLSTIQAFRSFTNASAGALFIRRSSISGLSNERQIPTNLAGEGYDHFKSTLTVEELEK